MLLREGLIAAGGYSLDKGDEFFRGEVNLDESLIGVGEFDENFE